LSSLHAAQAQIVACERCPRLRRYCNRIASQKRRAYLADDYWGRPVPGFGDPNARLLVLGLAPAAHGANRTGRLFTGDGNGGSGDFLMSALHRAGLANQPTSRRADDGLLLRDVFIVSAVRCAPPQNKPAPEEIARCLPHLEAELACLPQVRVVMALGRIGFDVALRILNRGDHATRPRPQFGHGLSCQLPRGLVLIACYHPSRQNTNTGRLTPGMMDDVLAEVRRRVEEAGP
jgi:uracil-DNA glycosylase